MTVRDDEKRKSECGDEAETGSGAGESPLSRWYEICIGAQLDASWSEWFEGLEMQPCGKGWTILRGGVPDQAALLGILNKLCRLNLPLISVNEIKGNKGGSETGQEGGE